MTKFVVNLVIIILLIALGLVAGPKLIGEKGYVLITLHHWKIELTVISALILLIGSYFVAWLVLRLIATLLALAGVSANWIAQFSSRHNKERFFNGLLANQAERFPKAEKYLNGIAGSEWFGVDWLTLAEMAGKQGDKELQEQHLLAAFKIESSRLAALHQLSKLYKDEDRHAGVLSLLAELSEKQKKDEIAVSVEADVLATQGKWQELLERLEGWKKSLPKAQFEVLTKQAALGCYAEIASKKGANELKNYWRMAPRKHKKDTAHQFAYISLLIDQRMDVEAENELLAAQSKSFSPSLLPLFRRLRLKQPTKTIQKLESWLKQDENNLQLLDAIAEVAINAGDYELAEKVLRKRLNLRTDKESQLLLAKTKVARNDLPGAVALYQQIT